MKKIDLLTLFLNYLIHEILCNFLLTNKKTGVFFFSMHTFAISDSGGLERSIHDKDTKSILITPVPRLAIFNLG